MAAATSILAMWACDGKEGKGPEFPNTVEAWGEVCSSAVRRNISCGRIPLEQEVEAIAVCIKSEACAKAHLRTDGLMQYMECESRAMCQASCTESIGAALSPGDAHGGLRAACEKLPAKCVGQKRGCEAILQSNASHLFSDAILRDLEACASNPDCVLAGDCMSAKVSEIGDLMFLCKNPKKS